MIAATGLSLLIIMRMYEQTLSLPRAIASRYYRHYHASVDSHLCAIGLHTLLQEITETSRNISAEILCDWINQLQSLAIKRMYRNRMKMMRLRDSIIPNRLRKFP